MSDAHSTPWRIWLGYLACSLPGGAALGMVPLLTSSAMASRHLNEAQLGLAFGFDLLINASLLIYLSTRLSKISPRPLGIIGLLIVVAGNTLCMFGDSYLGLVLGFGLRGAGLACAASAAGALAARLPSPQRMIGAMTAPIVVLAVINPIVAGRLAEQYGQIGPYGMYVAAAIISIPLCFFGPPGRNASTETEPAANWRAMLAMLRHPFIIAALTAFIGLSAIWPFFGTVTGRFGLDSSHTGDLIALVTVIGGALGITSAFVRDTWVAPVVLGSMVVYGIGGAAMVFAPNVPTLITFAAITSLGYVLLLNLFVVIAVRLDRSGGLNAAATGWTAISSAIAPALGGALITATRSVTPLAGLSIVSAAIAFVALRRATRAL